MIKNWIIVVAGCLFATMARAIDVYVSPDSDMGQMMAGLDKTAAQAGDTPSMARIAKDCFMKDDMKCAYRWSARALNGQYLYSVGKVGLYRRIREAAKNELTPDEIKQIDAENRAFSAKRSTVRASAVPKTQKTGSGGNSATMSVEQLCQEGRNEAFMRQQYQLFLKMGTEDIKRKHPKASDAEIHNLLTKLLPYSAVVSTVRSCCTTAGSYKELELCITKRMYEVVMRNFQKEIDKILRKM